MSKTYAATLGETCERVFVFLDTICNDTLARDMRQIVLGIDALLTLDSEKADFRDEVSMARLEKYE